MPMNRMGSMMPGSGSGTMAGNVLGSMFGGGKAPGATMGGMGGFAGAGGGGGGGVGRIGGPVQPGFGLNRGPNNNFGLGDRPDMNSPAIQRYQAQCAAGDGYACNQLQIMMGNQSNEISKWEDEYNRQRQMYGARTGSPMTSGRWG